MDDVTWAALTLTLTVAGGLWTWFAFRRRGLAAGLRGAGLTLLPLAAYLTNTLRMFTRIADAVTDWALSLVFSPVVWAGIVLAGVAVVLLGAGRVLDRRGPGRRSPEPVEKGSRPAGAVGAPAPARAESPAADPEMAEIEALLRRRGIE